ERGPYHVERTVPHTPSRRSPEVAKCESVPRHAPQPRARKLSAHPGNPSTAPRERSGGNRNNPGERGFFATHSCLREGADVGWANAPDGRSWPSRRRTDDITRAWRRSRSRSAPISPAPP